MMKTLIAVVAVVAMVAMVAVAASLFLVPIPAADAARVVAGPQSYVQAPAPSYWYDCEGARAYYPYVKECPGGWLTVATPTAPESQR